ncbi:MAG: hypothetical protein QM831_30365 [Kofleriaceae bacterium]
MATALVACGNKDQAGNAPAAKVATAESADPDRDDDDVPKMDCAKATDAADVQALFAAGVKYEAHALAGYWCEYMSGIDGLTIIFNQLDPDTDRTMRMTGGRKDAYALAGFGDAAFYTTTIEPYVSVAKGNRLCSASLTGLVTVSGAKPLADLSDVDRVKRLAAICVKAMERVK